MKTSPWRVVAQLLAVTVVTIIFILAASTPALAHPGHGWRDHHASHFLTSPDHLAVLALAGAAAWGLAWGVRHVAARRWLQYLGGSAVLLSAALWLVRF
jgi:hypothetical protein